jgi:signal transduction histidine kinase
VLLYYARKQKNVPFRPIFLLFGLFIFACGFGHLMSYVTTLSPVYRFDALVKIVTAIASWGTVVALIGVAPRALAMRMPEDLEREIAHRKIAEENLRQLNIMLEERTRQLQAANAELESFCYSVSHDIRTPLRGIVGNSRMVLEDAADRLDEENKLNLQRMATAARRLGALVDGLLHFSRLGRGELEVEDVDLSSLAAEVAEQLPPEAKVQIAPGLHAQAEPNLLRQVLFNLMDNAVKYSLPGADAHIEFGAQEHEGEQIFYLRDHGIGFDMVYADKIFGPFERLHKDDDYPGTGIGLATVKRIVERHGGRIWAESRPGEGATFFFTLGRA